jgi:hypothetical protein
MHDETAQRFAELFSAPRRRAACRASMRWRCSTTSRNSCRSAGAATRSPGCSADRLVELDLLDQAGEILRYQMEKRLTGAARSTVAAKLAMISLMNGKPAEALRALSTTRLMELPGDVKRARLLLEAKALSDLSRTDQALELLEAERGPRGRPLARRHLLDGHGAGGRRARRMSACSAKAGAAPRRAQREASAPT